MAFQLTRIPGGWSGKTGDSVTIGVLAANTVFRSAAYPGATALKPDPSGNTATFQIVAALNPLTVDVFVAPVPETWFIVEIDAANGATQQLAMALAGRPEISASITGGA